MVRAHHAVAMTARPLRFGISGWGRGDPDRWRESCREAEAMGFDVLHVADHLVEGCPPPLLALAVAAEATERIRLGTLVLNNDFWNPVILAREAAALDRWSGGRFELGLGAGHMAAEYEGTGIAFDPAGVRVDRLEAAVRTIKAELASESMWPKPAARIPLLVGGNGRRVQALGATEGDIVGFVGFTHRQKGAAVDLADFGPDALERQIARTREAAGDRFHELELQVLVQQVEITDDRRGVCERMAPEWGLDPEVLLASPYLCIGTHDQIADQLREQAERFGTTYTVVFGHSGKAFAPVIERLQSSSSST